MEMMFTRRLASIAVPVIGLCGIVFVLAGDAAHAEAQKPSIIVQFRSSSELVRLEVPAGINLGDSITALKRSSAVRFAEENFTVRAAAVTPNDPIFSEQTYLENVQAPQGWQVTTGSSHVTVALLDSGVDITHPDLKENIWTNGEEIPGDGIDNDSDGYVDDVFGWDFVNEIPDPNPKFGGAFTDTGIHHGTLLAGVIAAQGNNKIGIAGVSWRSKIMPLRVLNNRGEGDILTVVKAIDFAIAKKAQVMNLSFVGPNDSTFFRDAVKRAYDAGIVVVAASGNDETNGGHGYNLNEHPLYPACYQGDDIVVISVGSLEDSGRKATFSNYGPCIHISAPGVDISSTQVVRYEQPGFDAFYGSGWSGTSFSTAVVTGAVALIRAIDSSISPGQILQVLQQTCDPIDAANPEYIGKLGCGRLNVSAALQRTMQRVQQQSVPLSQDERDVPASSLIIITTDGKKPLTIFSGNGAPDPVRTLFPYGTSRAPFSVAASRDGSLIVTAAGKGGGPQLRLLDRSLQLKTQFFAYDAKFHGGVSVAVGDVDGDGEEDIITAPGWGGGPHIRIFDQSGGLKYQFMAQGISGRNGLRVATGDVNSDGRSDILVTALQGASSQVSIYSADGVLITRFTPYTKKIGNATVAVGDIDGDGEIEIVTAPSKGSAMLKVYSTHGKERSSWYPFGRNFTGGVNISTGDMNGDGTDEIIATPLSKGGPQVRVFFGDGTLGSQFFAFAKTLRTGIATAVLH